MDRYMAETAIDLLASEREEQDMHILELENRVKELHAALKAKRTKPKRHAYNAARKSLSKARLLALCKMQVTLCLMANADESKECHNKGYHDGW